MLSFFLNNWLCCLAGGLWVIHKFKHYLPSGKIEDLGESGRYNSINQARVQTYRKASDEFPKNEVDIHDTWDGDGKYFIVTVKAIATSIIEFIFMPIPPPEK